MGKEAKKSTKKKTKAKPAAMGTTKSTKNKTNVKATKEKPNFLRKRFRVILPVIVILCIIGLVWFTIVPEVVKADEAKARLVVDSGDVQVKTAGGSWAPAENGMDIFESDSVKTGDNSSATIILFKSSIIRLGNNTEVTLKEIIEEEQTSVTIQQDAGRTWSTVSKVSGIDDYEVQTPTAVASVRGTTFDVNVDEDGITVVSVIKGIVNVTATENGTVYTVQLNENYSVTVDFDEIGEPGVFEPDDWIINNLLEDETFKGDLKETLYEQIEPYMDELKSEIGMSEEEIEILIDGYIEGEFAIPPDTPDKYKKLFELP